MRLLTSNMNWALVGFVAAGLAGCGKAKEAVENTKAGQYFELTGVHQTDCEATKFDPKAGLNFQGSRIFTLDATANKADLRRTYFTDKGCPAGKELWVATYSGKLTVGDVLPNTARTRQLAYTFDKVTAMPLNADGAHRANDLKICNINTWAVNKEENITGKDCGAFGKYPSQGNVQHTTYLLQGDDVYMGSLPCEGDDPTCSNPKLRPQDLKLNSQPNIVFRKK